MDPGSPAFYWEACSVGQAAKQFETKPAAPAAGMAAQFSQPQLRHPGACSSRNSTVRKPACPEAGLRETFSLAGRTQCRQQLSVAVSIENAQDVGAATFAITF